MRSVATAGCCCVQVRRGGHISFQEDLKLQSLKDYALLRSYKLQTWVCLPSVWEGAGLTGNRDLRHYEPDVVWCFNKAQEPPIPTEAS